MSHQIHADALTQYSEIKAKQRLSLVEAKSFLPTDFPNSRSSTTHENDL
jgi:hypothetical protein